MEQHENPMKKTNNNNNVGMEKEMELPTYTNAVSLQDTKPVEKPPAFVYEKWQGNHSFSRTKTTMYVIGEKMPPISLIILWVTYILHYLSIEFQYVNIEQSMAVRTYGLTTLTIFLLNIYSTYNFCLAWLTEPGIIPRRKKLSSSLADMLNISMRSPYKQTLIINGKKREIFFCRSCNIYRPPRAQHCPVCNCCVERFDHHCPWVGNCIGQRNYRFFFRFLIVTFSYFIFSTIITCIHMALYDGGFRNAINSNPMSLLVIILNFLISLFVGGLCVFHTYLSCTNQTTFDNVRGEETGLYGVGMDLIFDLFYLREPTKVKGLDYEETLSSSSSEDEEEEEETDEDNDNDDDGEDWNTMNDRMIEGMNNPYVNSVDDGIQKEEEEEKQEVEQEESESVVVPSNKKDVKKEEDKKDVMVASSDAIDLVETEEEGDIVTTENV